MRGLAGRSVRRRRGLEPAKLEIKQPVHGLKLGLEILQPLIVLAPSNPIVSIGPILAIDEFHRVISDRTAPALAISPLIGGKALKGPADRMMETLGHESTALGVARLYEGLIDGFVIDHVDAEQAAEIEELGIAVSEWANGRLYVQHVLPFSPARGKLRENDTIAGANGSAISGGASQLRSMVNGERITLQVERWDAGTIDVEIEPRSLLSAR